MLDYWWQGCEAEIQILETWQQRDRIYNTRIIESTGITQESLKTESS